MAQISSSSKTILITGINGYIASVTALHLLRKGYAVIGTCRSRARVEGMIRGAYKEFSDRITLVEVTDMTVPGAFDEAVKGAWILSQPVFIIRFFNVYFFNIVQYALLLTQ